MNKKTTLRFLIPAIGLSALMAMPPAIAAGSQQQAANFNTTAAAKTASAADIVGCWAKSDEPTTLVYNKPPIIAEGEITRCTPTPPEDCRVETDLEQWYSLKGEWIVVASGPVKWGCTPGKNSRSTATYKCTHDPRGINYKYRTRTYLTVQVEGRWYANTKTSGEKKWWCY